MRAPLDLDARIRSLDPRRGEAFNATKSLRLDALIVASERAKAFETAAGRRRQSTAAALGRFLDRVGSRT